MASEEHSKTLTKSTKQQKQPIYGRWHFVEIFFPSTTFFPIFFPPNPSTANVFFFKFPLEIREIFGSDARQRKKKRRWDLIDGSPVVWTGTVNPLLGDLQMGRSLDFRVFWDQLTGIRRTGHHRSPVNTEICIEVAILHTHTDIYIYIII